MKYIDCHAHVNFDAYAEDRDEVIKRALDDNTWIINVGTQLDTAKFAVELAEKYNEGVYAIVGLHPVHTSASYHDESEIGEGGKEFTPHLFSTKEKGLPLTTFSKKSGEGFTSRGEEFEMESYRELAKHPKVVAIGECGLDYFHMEGDTKAIQEKAFRGQIELAKSVGKPLMLHIRNGNGEIGNAYSDALAILDDYPEVIGNVHFFAGTVEDAEAFLSRGFYISFTGVITFAEDYEKLVRAVPLNRILSETDCPFVTPKPYRGKRNEPLYVQEVVKKIAEIKEESLEIVAEKLFENAERFFGFKK
ncbi:hypothetical protein COB55_00520 [Candidatus Wolfebacteria bacterium]|nr:MAG: hypothetical protein COB55_00520 [Candidatus Wolfebacteria bacterium]